MLNAGHVPGLRKGRILGRSEAAVRGEDGVMVRSATGDGFERTRDGGDGIHT